MTQTAVVNTKSAAASKINWIAAATGLGVLITQFTPMLPAKYQGSATALVGLIGALTTFVTRTWFTTSIVSNSVPAEAESSVVTYRPGSSQQNMSDSLNIAALQAAKATAAR